jgi:cytochrome c556
MRAILAISVIALAASAASTASSQDAPPLDVRHAMQQEVNPAIVRIWDVTNNALDDSGNLDPALVGDEGWAQIASAAADLAAATDRMAAAQSFVAADPGNWMTEDYEVPMDVVQASLDAEPAGFRAFAAAFSRTARELEAAATARNLATTSEIVGRMDAECAGCHTAYWYPEN